MAEAPAPAPNERAVSFGGPEISISLRPRVSGLMVPAEEWDRLRGHVKKTGKGVDVVWGMAWGFLALGVAGLAAAEGLASSVTSLSFAAWLAVGLGGLFGGAVSFVFWFAWRDDSFSWSTVAVEEMDGIRSRHDLGEDPARGNC